MGVNRDSNSLMRDGISATVSNWAPRRKEASLHPQPKLGDELARTLAPSISVRHHESTVC